MDVSKYIGIPYKDKGRDLDGLDCWGLLWMIYREQLNIEVPSYINQYNSSTNFKPLARLISCEVNPWQEIERHNEQVGDAVLLRLFGYPVHVGVIIQPRKMIHVFRGTNTCIQSIYGMVWNLRIVGIFRHQSLFPD